MGARIGGIADIYRPEGKSSDRREKTNIHREMTWVMQLWRPR